MRRWMLRILLCFASACSATQGSGGVNTGDTGNEIVDTRPDVVPWDEPISDRPADPTRMDATTVVDGGEGDARTDAATDRPDTSLPLWPSCPDPSERGCGQVCFAGGSFRLGSDYDPDRARGRSASSPAMIDELCMDAYEMTVARFRRLWALLRARPPTDTIVVPYPGGREITVRVEDTAEPVPTNPRCRWSASPLGWETTPINCISWETAMVACALDGGRMPTPAEWEFAARYRPIKGGASPPRTYPWGEAPPARQLCWMMGIPCDVGSYPAIGGIYDQAGSMWEWLASSHRKDWNMDGAAPYEDACWAGANPLCLLDPSETVMHGVRGVGYQSSSSDSARTSAVRGFTGVGSDVGVRCVRVRSTPPG